MKDKNPNKYKELDEINLKQAQTEQAGCINEPYPKTTGVIGGSFYPASPVEELEKNAAYHQESAYKQAEGAYFLRENPAFNEFIRLIRKGSIHI